MHPTQASSRAILDPVPYFGQTLRERQSNGLGVNMSLYPPGRQPLHVHEHPTFSMLIAGRARDLSRSWSHEQPVLSVVFHPTTEPNANEIGPGGTLGCTLEYQPAWLQLHGLTEQDLGGYRFLAPSVWSRLACLRLLGIAFEQGPNAEADLETLALEMLEPLVQPLTLPPASPAPRWLLRAEEFLHAHFRSSVSLRSAAREAGVHPVYFARVFRRHHGCSVSAYLHALRLTEAAELILQHGLSLVEAACTAGFADQAHLTRCCARSLGFTPKRIRRVRTLYRD
jgi:AraC family transcriptional regulator